jgi:hypothetical protein
LMVRGDLKKVTWGLRLSDKKGQPCECLGASTPGGGKSRTWAWSQARAWVIWSTESKRWCS